MDELQIIAQIIAIFFAGLATGSLLSLRREKKLFDINDRLLKTNDRLYALSLEVLAELHQYLQEEQEEQNP